MAATVSGLKNCHVWKGRILDVDPTMYRCTVGSMPPAKKIIPNVPFASPYLHHDSGEGVYVMPEVGSIVWVCEPSDSGKAFIMGWAPLGDGEDYTESRPDLNPGDIYLGTRDGNAIILRRGGVVQIKSGSIAQRYFLPINNWIKDFCENFGLYTLAGDLTWTIDRPEETADGSRPALLKLSAREFANDPQPIAVLEIGSHDEKKEAILSLIIREDGQEGAADKISLFLDKTGDMWFTVEGNVEWKVTKDFRLEVGQTITVTIPLDQWMKFGSDASDEPWLLGNVSAAALRDLKALIKTLLTSGKLKSHGVPCVADPTWVAELDQWESDRVSDPTKATDIRSTICFTEKGNGGNGP